MLIILASVIAVLFGIAGTFLSIEARRAAVTQNDGLDSSSDQSGTWQPTSAGE